MTGNIGQEHVHSLGVAIADFLMPHRGRVSKQAVFWKMGDKAHNHAVSMKWLEFDTRDTVEATRTLRASVSRAIHAAGGNSVELQEHAAFVIGLWGKLHTSATTINSYVERFRTNASPEIKSAADLRASRKLAHPFPFEGVASWSKWLSFSWPSWALIYDSRIAFCINAINVIKRVGAPAFPAPPGQGRILARLNPQMLAVLGAVHADRGQFAVGVGKGSPEGRNGAIKMLQAFVVDEEYFYERYLDVMRVAHDRLWDTDTTFEHTEMLLFTMTNEIFVDLASFVLSGGAHGVPGGGKPFVAQSRAPGGSECAAPGSAA